MIDRWRDINTSQLEDYLDGRLVDDERLAFRRRIATQPELREAIEHTERIDRSLRSVFAPPSPQALRDMVTAAVQADPGGGAAPVMSAPRRGMPRWALAAALLLALGGAWMIWRSVPQVPPSPYDLEQTTMVAFYGQALADGFTPQWVCRDDDEFAFSFRAAHGQALVLRDVPSDVAPLGLTYCFVISPRTICILAEAQDRPVMVFVDRLDAEPGPVAAPAGDLHLHRRTLGALVIYELSPLETPRLLPLLRDPRPAEASPEGNAP